MRLAKKIKRVGFSFPPNCLGDSPFHFWVADWAGGMMVYGRTVCSYVYDPSIGDPESRIPPGTLFEKLPEDWVYPVCGASKDLFELLDE